MKRYTITEGAKTTSDGTVIHASSHGSINGARIALEDDTIFCKGCGAPGRIFCVGPRLVELWSGKQVALENDLCICGCSPLPRLISNQTVRYQVIGDAMAAAHAKDSVGGSNAANAGSGPDSNGESYDLHFIVTDEKSGFPIIERAYIIELANGALVKGLTDRDGRTERIASGQAEHATIRVFEADPTSINPYWDR